jgi:uncharacterized protein with NRDE domain
MCLIAFAWRAIPGIRLLVAANRDEYHTRPTAHAAFWQDAPHILGGRDLQDGGTWMGVTRAGRFAALTNHRTQTGPQTAMRSRGHLVAEFLRGSDPAQSYCQSVAAEAGQYNGFNLLAGDGEALAYTGNHSPLPHAVAPGIHTADASAAKRRVAEGFQFVAVASDVAMMLAKAEDELAAMGLGGAGQVVRY